MKKKKELVIGIPDETMHVSVKECEETLCNMWDREWNRKYLSYERALREPNTENICRMIEAEARFGYISDLHVILKIYRDA